MTVLQIVEKYLKDNGYDGLYETDSECACGISDLQPCGEAFHDCVAGYAFPCTCGDHHDYHIGSKAMKEEYEVERKEREMEGKG